MIMIESMTDDRGCPRALRSSKRDSQVSCSLWQKHSKVLDADKKIEELMAAAARSTHS